MKRILVISWFFPPVNSSEGLVTYKLLKNSKYKYDVFTQKNSKLWSYSNDDNLEELSNVESYFSDNSTLNEWFFDAIEFYEKNLDKYDIVMTRAMPEESHKIGLEIKKLNPNIIWIASFGDPIAQNPFTLKVVPNENPFSLQQRYIRKMSTKEIFSIKRTAKSLLWRNNYKKNHKKLIKNNDILQKEIIEKSDNIICNSEYQKKYMLKTYKKNFQDKVIILPHSYVRQLYTSSSKDNAGRLRFSYIGHLDDIRTPRLLLEAIKDLKENFVDFENKTIFEFYGNLSNNDKLYIINNDLLEVVKIKKPVTYSESLNIMKKTDWLIHIDSNLSDIIDDNIFFAAKLADYMGSESNILGITMLNGISADILREYNSLVISHSADEIRNYLYLIIYKNYKIKQKRNFRELYDAKNVSKNFDNEIKKIVKENNKM